MSYYEKKYKIFWIRSSVFILSCLIRAHIGKFPYHWLRSLILQRMSASHFIMNDDQFISQCTYLTGSEAALEMHRFWTLGFMREMKLHLGPSYWVLDGMKSDGGSERETHFDPRYNRYIAHWLSEDPGDNLCVLEQFYGGSVVDTAALQY